VFAKFISEICTDYFPPFVRRGLRSNKFMGALRQTGLTPMISQKAKLLMNGTGMLRSLFTFAGILFPSCH